MNQNALKKFGYNWKEILNISFSNLIDEEDRIAIINSIKEIEQNGRQSKPIEYKIRTKDGNFIYIEAYGIPIKKNGKIYAILEIAKDITNHKKAEFALKESEIKLKRLNEELEKKIVNGTIKLKKSDKKYHLLFNDSPYPIFLINSQGNVIDCNLNTEDFLGYKREEIIGKRIYDLNITFKEDMPNMKNRIIKIFKGQKTEPLVIKLRKKDNTIIWALGKSSLINLNHEAYIQSIFQDITAKKWTEQKLRESEEKYRLISENANDLITIINQNFKLEYINEQAYFNLLGYKKEDVIGKTLLEPIHPDDIKKASKNLRDGFKYGQSIGEVRIGHKNGKYFWFENRGKTFTDPNGEKKAIMISRDITERKFTEEQLKESEEKYRNILENIKQGYFEVDVKGNFIFINKALGEIFGDKVDDILGNYFGNYVDKETESKIYESFNQVYKTGLAENRIQFVVIRKNGKCITVESSIHLRFDSKGNKIGFSGLILDITERTKWEQQLRESEEKFRNLFENSPNTILLIDFQGKIIDCNSGVERKAGYKREDFIGKIVFNLPIFHLRTIQKIKEYYKIILKGEIPTPIEIQVYKKEGTLMWVQMRASIVKLSNTSLIQVIVQDITEKKEAENIIREENKKLKELDQIRRDFISRASHELKTPLTGVHGASQIIMNLYQDQIGNNALEFMKIIIKGSKRLKVLIENLLDISRLDIGKLELHKENLDLAQLIIDCASDMTYLARDRDLSLNLDLPEKYFFKVDKIHIGQAITNLLSNAIKNTPIEGRINISLKERDGFAEIDIKDNGVGLTKDEMDKIFIKFGKIERYGKGLDIVTEGCGLGLYITKEIISLHGGVILVQSEGRNKGSLFRIKLPVN